MSKRYAQVKGYYDMELWNEKRVHDAVGKGWITEDEYRQITGQKYE